MYIQLTFSIRVKFYKAPPALSLRALTQCAPSKLWGLGSCQLGSLPCHQPIST